MEKWKQEQKQGKLSENGGEDTEECKTKSGNSRAEKEEQIYRRAEAVNCKQKREKKRTETVERNWRSANGEVGTEEQKRKRGNDWRQRSGNRSRNESDKTSDSTAVHYRNA